MNGPLGWNETRMCCGHKMPLVSDGIWECQQCGRRSEHALMRPWIENTVYQKGDRDWAEKKTPVKVIVTGHQGTLGRPLCDALRANGHRVYGIDKDHDEHGWSDRADVANYRELADIFAACGADSDTVIYHLAAEFGRHNGEDYYETLWRTNVVGTKNILLCQRDMGFRLIFASSSEVYGEGPFASSQLVVEGTMHEGLTRTQPLHHANDYAMSKWVNEGQIRNAARRWGTETMILRFFNAYGPGEYYHRYRSVIALFVYRALHGEPYTVYRGYHRVFQYIDDFIRTLAHACTAFQPGATINIGGREYRPVSDVHKILSAQLGLDSDRRDVVWEDRDEHNTVDKRPDITKAEQMLGHDPTTTLEDGIARTILWMRGVYF